MPKNLVPNHFDYSGVYIEGSRSAFRFNKGVQASFMSGMLNPLGDPIRVFPGVKLALKIAANIISNTMVAVPLNGVYVDFFAVWVPDRVVWTHQPQFLGENDSTAWTQSANYTYPSIKLNVLVNDLHTALTNTTNVADESVSAGNLFLANHYGLYHGAALSSGQPAYDQEINVLAMRGYYACWNHLFRDENYQRPVLFSKTDVGNSGEFGYLLRDYVLNTGKSMTTVFNTVLGADMTANYAVLMPLNKFHDAFTSVLPQAQFGNGIALGAGDIVNITSAGTQMHSMGSAIKFGLNGGGTPADYLLGIQSNNTVIAYQGSTGTGTKSTITSSNLIADLSGALGTINQFRANIMTQRYIEALARGGRRVPEIYEAIWNVKNSKAIYDYPELLSHERYVCGVQQVVATADSGGSGWTSHLGDRGAYSLTVLRDIPCCEKDFSEFGYLHIFYGIRSTNQYSQMIPEHFTRKLLLDEYNPYFDHIGEVAVPNHIVNTAALNANNFGFQEAWWSERTQQNICTGALNKVFGSLGYHTIGEVFDSSLMTCTPGYVTFDPAVFDDVFVSSYWAYPQFLIDAKIYGTNVARMSQHSTPGIVGRI